MLPDPASPPPTRYYFADILTHAAQVFGLHQTHITARTRKRAHVRIRGAIALVAKELTLLSYAEIGARLGKLHHSTVMHAADAARKLAEESPEFSLLVQELKARVTGRSGLEVTEREIRRAMPPGSWRRTAKEHRDHVSLQRGVTDAARNMATAAKPRNDFRAGDGPVDGSHRFHARVAKGSSALLAAMDRAR